MSPVTEPGSVDGRRKWSLSVCLPHCPPASRLLWLCFRPSVSVRVPAARLYLSECLPACVCPSACLSVSACPSGCLSASVPVPACLSDWCPSVSVRVPACICPSVYPSVSVRLLTCVCPSACRCAACMPVLCACGVVNTQVFFIEVSILQIYIFHSLNSCVIHVYNAL